jgi:hypothetical protein
MGLRWLDSTTLAVQPSAMADDEGSNNLNEEGVNAKGKLKGSFLIGRDLWQLWILDRSGRLGQRKLSIAIRSSCKNINKPLPHRGDYHRHSLSPDDS